MKTRTGEPAWKAWTYQRRLLRYTTINPEPLPEPLRGDLICSTVLAIVDIRAGRRAPGALPTKSTARVKGQLATPRRVSGRLRRIRVCRPDAWSVEVAAVIVGRERSGAIALRWDCLEGEWTLTALEG